MLAIESVEDIEMNARMLVQVLSAPCRPLPAAPLAVAKLPPNVAAAYLSSPARFVQLLAAPKACAPKTETYAIASNRFGRNERANTRLLSAVEAPGAVEGSPAVRYL